MSYLRGEYYTYRGGEDENGQETIFLAGLGFVPLEVFDALVVMRAAELAESGELEAVERHTIEKYAGNFGSSALLKKYGLETPYEMVDRLAAEAEKGYDSERLRPRGD